jgi:hypothetical protein
MLPKPYVTRLPTTEVSPFIPFHSDVRNVCSLRRHHICVTAMQDGAGTTISLG